jgi:hypothetical protein
MKLISRFPFLARLKGTTAETFAQRAVDEHSALSSLSGWEALDSVQRDVFATHPAFARVFKSGFKAEAAFSLEHNGCRVVIAKGEGNRFLSAVDMLATQGFTDGRVECYVVVAEDLATRETGCKVSHFRVAASYRRILNGLRNSGPAGERSGRHSGSR